MKPRLEQKVERPDKSVNTDVFSNAVDKTLQSDPSVVPDDDNVEPEGEEDLLDIEDFELDYGEEDEPEDAPPPLDPNIAALTQNVNKIAEALKPATPVKQRKERAKPQPVDTKALREKFNKDFHETDDPFELVQGMANELLGPALAQQNATLQNVNKNMLIQDPNYAYVMGAYEDDIENIIASLPPAQQTHPDAYKFAADKVIIDNLADVTAHAAEANMEKKNKVVKHRPAPTGMSGVTGASTPNKPKTPRLRVTAADEAYARAYGISIKDACLARRNR